MLLLDRPASEEVVSRGSETDDRYHKPGDYAW